MKKNEYRRDCKGNKIRKTRDRKIKGVNNKDM